MLLSLEKVFYELKPILYIFAAMVLLSANTSSSSNLIASLTLLYYAGALLLLRHRFRGSFNQWFHQSAQK